jgi:lysophospholipase L1-like esterase
MKRIMVMVLGVLAVSSFAPAALAEEEVPGLPVDLALGDSWAVGVGAADPATGGYVGRSHAAFQDTLDCLPAASEEAADGCKHLQLVKLGVGGSTTTGVVANQLPTSVELLAARNDDDNPANDVEVVTLTVGGNDVFRPVLEACLGGLTENCLQVIHQILAAVEVNYAVILGGLQEAAGADTPIVVTTYDNPIPTCNLAGIPGASALGALVLEGGVPGVLEAGLNDIIREVAGNNGAEAADVYGLLAPDDWVGGRDCLHPDDSGYAKIAQVVVQEVTG